MAVNRGQTAKGEGHTAKVTTYCIIPYSLSVHRGSHVTIIYDALDLTAQPPPRYQTWYLPRSPGYQAWTYPLLLPSGGHYWRHGPTLTDIWWSSLEACSKLFTWGPTPTSTDTQWSQLKHIQLASRRYASYWNVSLLQLSVLLTASNVATETSGFPL